MGWGLGWGLEFESVPQVRRRLYARKAEGEKEGERVLKARERACDRMDFN